MKIYTIEQKMSNSGSIHDLESDSFDRKIKFPKGAIFAVVTAAYYGGKGYTTHRSEQAAIKASRDLGNYSHSIIDSDGNRYTIAPGYNYDSLIKEI